MLDGQSWLFTSDYISRNQDELYNLATAVDKTLHNKDTAEA
jgi:hypothetical protein